MQAAQLAHHVVAGPQVQVIRVGKLDLCAQLLLQIQCADAALDGGLGTHIHEHRRLYLAAVGAGEHAPPRLALFFDNFEHLCLLHIIQRLLRHAAGAQQPYQVAALDHEIHVGSDNGQQVPL